MRRNRRKFFSALLAATGAVAGAGAYWASTSNHRLARVLRMFYGDANRELLPASAKPNPNLWSDHDISVAWLGHSTVLVNFYGLRILTDPVFSARVGIGIGVGVAGPKRYVSPALRFEELPPIDLVLLSHAHYDHMDLPSLRRFSESTAVVTAKQTRDILAGTRLNRIQELAWNERATIPCGRGEIEVTAIEVKHWGQRWPSELERGYNGYTLRREGKAILFGGDTAYTPVFSRLRTAGPYEVALMPVGAYQPWIRSHCTPEEALQMADAAGARYFVPIHHLTFKLSDEPMTEPIERLSAALAKEPERLALRQVGEQFICPQA